MGTGNAANAILGSGILKANGVQLGIFGHAVLRVPSEMKILIGEEDNGPIKVTWLGGPIILGGTITDWDEDAVAALLPGGSAGSNGPAVTWPFQVGRDAPNPGAITFEPVDNVRGGPLITLSDAYAVPELESQWMFTAYQFLEPRIAIIAASGSVTPAPTV